MARTSKKKPPERMYSVGIYTRLSVDSDERKNESIETQVEIANEFIRQQKNMVVYDVYTDIGKTGTHFKREGFERMMRDVKMRKIDCIIVKDLSRFGRSHIETGNYIEKIFPFMGVRFIAVTDHFDSMNLSGQNDMLGVSLKNLINEMYAKDIAAKVKSSKRTKWEQGSYTGGIPPYGYRAEWIEDKKCLFIEKTTSDIVKKIFDLFISGRNMKEIVLWLYENQIVRPAEYHKTGQIYCKEKEKLEQWSRGTVKMILTNPIYMGCLVQRRICGKKYRMCDRHDIASGAWSIKKHTHNAIISTDLFFRAAARLEKNSVSCSENEFSKTVPLKEDIFADILYCGDCGLKMKRFSAVKENSSNDKTRTFYYNCRRADRIDESKCAGRSITLSALSDAIKETIRQELSLSAICLKELCENSRLEAETQKKAWNRQLLVLEKKLENITKLGSEQYLKYRLKEMDEECFWKAKEANDKKTATLQKNYTAAVKKLHDIDTQSVRKKHLLYTLVNDDAENELHTEMVRGLLDRIEIYPEHRIKLFFAFSRSED